MRRQMSGADARGLRQHGVVSDHARRRAGRECRCCLGPGLTASARRRMRHKAHWAWPEWLHSLAAPVDCCAIFALGPQLLRSWEPAPGRHLLCRHVSLERHSKRNQTPASAASERSRGWSAHTHLLSATGSCKSLPCLHSKHLQVAIEQLGHLQGVV